MQCEQAETCLAQLAAGDSVDGDTTLIEASAHVETCDACREKLADYRLTLKLLADGFAAEAEQSGPIPTLSADRRKKLEARFNAPPELVATTTVEQPNRFNIRNYLRPLGVAASFGLVALGAWGLMNTIQGQPAFGPVATMDWSEDLPELVIPEADAARLEPTGTIILSDGTKADDYQSRYQSERMLRQTAEKAATNREGDINGAFKLYEQRLGQLEGEKAQLKSQLGNLELHHRNGLNTDSYGTPVDADKGLSATRRDSQGKNWKGRASGDAPAGGAAPQNNYWSFKGNKDLGGTVVDGIAIRGAAEKSSGDVTDGKDAYAGRANDDLDGDGLGLALNARTDQLKAGSALDRLERSGQEGQATGEAGAFDGGQGQSRDSTLGWTGKKSELDPAALPGGGGGGAGGRRVGGKLLAGESASGGTRHTQPPTVTDGRKYDNKPAPGNVTGNAPASGPSSRAERPAVTLGRIALPTTPDEPDKPADLPDLTPAPKTTPAPAKPDASGLSGRGRLGIDYWRSTVDAEPKPPAPPAPVLPAEPQPEADLADFARAPGPPGDPDTPGNRAEKDHAKKPGGSTYFGGVKDAPEEIAKALESQKESRTKQESAAKPKPDPAPVTGTTVTRDSERKNLPAPGVDPALQPLPDPRDIADAGGDNGRWQRGKGAADKQAESTEQALRFKSKDSKLDDESYSREGNDTKRADSRRRERESRSESTRHWDDEKLKQLTELNEEDGDEYEEHKPEKRAPQFADAPSFDLVPARENESRRQRAAEQSKEKKGRLENLTTEAGDDRLAKVVSEELNKLEEHQLHFAQQEAEDAEADPLPAASNFKSLPVNPFVMTERDRFSTFGIDTDSASYALARKYVRAGFRPPAGAIRMEEFVNAFDYNYANQSGRVFTVHAEAGDAPYGENLTLVKVGVKAKTIGRENRKPAHLVFVIDASGSMDRPDRLPLVKHSLGLLVSQLGPTDRVSIVAYGSKPIAVVEAVPASQKDKLRNAINRVQAGGSTNMIDALGMGYDFARNHFKPGEINRVIVCSDGVANVGATEAERMLDKVAANRTQGITLTNVGFGIGGYNDALMTDLAKKGDGNYVFVDTTAEAKRLFVDQLASTLQTVAKDAKIQVEFDPARVRRYRLIGYEARDIADKDFRNDTVDAGEVGSGQSATALYEVELLPAASNDNAVELADLGTVFVRYKNVETGAVEEISSRLRTDLIRQRTVSDDPRFYLAACAAEYAEVLRGSAHARGASIESIERKLIPIVQQLPLDRQAAELLDLVRRTKGLPAAP